jgi:hypothetical protein
MSDEGQNRNWRRAVNARNGAVNVLADSGITFARTFFEAIAIQDFYVTARVADQARLLQGVRAY